MTKTLITEEYRKLNAELHGRKAKYGAKGHDWLDRVIVYLKHLRREMATGSVYGNPNFKLNDDMPMTYLDYGCGKGSLVEAVKTRTDRWGQFEVFKYDPVTAPDLPEYAPTKFDFITCCDVLEHIEPDLLDNVLEDIHSKMGKQGLLVISQRLANKTLADGRNAHLIVEKTPWWMTKLAPYFHVIEVDPIKPTREGIELAVLVRPKGDEKPVGEQFEKQLLGHIASQFGLTHEQLSGQQDPNRFAPSADTIGQHDE